MIQPLSGGWKATCTRSWSLSKSSQSGSAICRDILLLFCEERMYGNKTLIDTPLFALLEKAVHEPHSATAGLTAAYDGFVTTLESLCESGVSHSHLKRTLCYTRQELLALRDDIAAGETRKEIASVCTKALGMIRCEEEILRHCIEHPERLQSLPIRSTVKEVSSGPLRWRGSMLGLMELICALYYSRVCDRCFGCPSLFRLVCRSFLPPL